MPTNNESPEEILEQALEIVDPAERAAYVETACACQLAAGPPEPPNSPESSSAACSYTSTRDFLLASPNAQKAGAVLLLFEDDEDGAAAVRGDWQTSKVGQSEPAICSRICNRPAPLGYCHGSVTLRPAS
jgi:hypothetical protein